MTSEGAQGDDVDDDDDDDDDDDYYDCDYDWLLELHIATGSKRI